MKFYDFDEYLKKRFSKETIDHIESLAEAEFQAINCLEASFIVRTHSTRLKGLAQGERPLVVSKARSATSNHTCANEAELRGIKPIRD